MSNQNPIYVIEMGEGMQELAYSENMTLAKVLSDRDSNKNVTPKVNGQTVSSDYVLQPGDQVNLVPNVEAGL